MKMEQIECSIIHIQPMKMELIECSETSANHNRTPGKYPKEYIQDSKHGESLKSSSLISPTFDKQLKHFFDVCVTVHP